MAENIKKKLADALIELAGRKSLDKITIKDLVEMCGISRQSFYYHYQDILDVIEWILQSNTEFLLDQTLKAESKREAMSIFIDFAFANHHFLQTLLASRHRELIEHMISKTLRSYLQELYLRSATGIHIGDLDADVALSFYTYGLAGVLLEHVTSKKTDRDKLTDQLCRLLPGELI